MYWDTDVTGFGLKVTPKGKRTFLLSYRTADHTQRKPRIGDFPEMKPEKAREIAKQWLADVAQGGDPSADRQRKRDGRGHGTVSELFEAYKQHKRKEGRRSLSEIERIFSHDILPVFGKRRADDISSHDVTKLLDAIDLRSTAMAWAVRRQLSAFYRWAVPRMPAGAVNPVIAASRPPVLKSRERTLTDNELKLLWLALEREPQHWRIALRLLILTGQRREEVLQADWAEIDVPQKIWTIPADRAKNGKAHLVPLSPASLALIEQLPHRTGKLFPKGTGATSKAAKRIRDAMPDVPHWRWHDIRRTVVTGLQKIDVRFEVTEAVVNHLSGSRSGIAGVYQRHDWAKEKRDALDRWAIEVNRIIA